MHVRQQIRSAIKTLVTGLTTTGANVFDSPVHLLDPASLPSLQIYARSEGIEVHTLSAPRDILRTVEIVIAGTVKAVDVYMNTLDTINEEVEAVMSTDLSLGGLAMDIYLTTIEISYEAGEQPIGRIEMSYNVEYRTNETNAGTPT